MLQPISYSQHLYLPLMILSDNQAKAQGRFTDAFAVLTVLGSNQDDLIDCSEVIPQPPSFTGQATFPAGFSMDDVEQAVRATPSSQLR